MLNSYSTAPPITPPSFPPVSDVPRFASVKLARHMRRIDFPVRPHLLKYLVVHLRLRPLDRPEQLEDYVLSSGGHWGLPLTVLLATRVKSARHEASVDDCTATLGINLRNFKAPYYDLTQGKLSPYVVFQFNDYCEDVFRKELYHWVAKHQERRGTIKDAILSYMALYDISEQDVAYCTLRRDVERNAPLLRRKKKAAAEKKPENFSMNLSQKISGLSQKKREVSQKIGVLSQKDTFSAVRQELNKLPLPLFTADFYFGPAPSAHAGR